MSLIPFDRAQRVVHMLEAFSQETGLSRINPGSITRAMMDAFVSELHAIEDIAQEGFSDVNPLSATGPYLHMLADMYGAQPVIGNPAFALADDGNFHFYVDQGTFGDINNGQDIVIPADRLRVYGQSQRLSETGDLEELPVSFRPVESITLPAAESQVYVSITAMQPGPDFNVASEALTDHNFSGYARNTEQLLKCKNNYPILNGSSDGDDENIRYELSRIYAVRDTTAIERLITLIDSIPGITEVLAEPNFSGSGTVDFFIDAESFVIPPSLLSEAQDVIQSSFQYGSQINVNGIKRVGLSVVSDIEFKRGVTDEQKDATIESIRAYLLDSILESGIAGSVDLSKIARDIALSVPTIARIGDGSGFDEVTVWRDAIQGSRYGVALTNRNVQLVAQRFERFLPEDNLVNPISLNAV